MDTTSTPSIRVSHHHRYLNPEAERHSPPRPSRSPASPMSIPNAPQDPSVPPPLPPPQHPDIDDDGGIGQQKGWDWFNKEYVNQHWTDFGKNNNAAVKPTTSLLGGGKKTGSNAEVEEDMNDNEIDPARRGSSISTITPAAHGSSDSMNESAVFADQEDKNSRPLNHRLQGERQLEQRSLDNSSQAYDRNLLSRIGGPNTPNRLSVSLQSPNGSDSTAISPGAEGRFDHIRHLSTSSASDRRHASFDGSHRLSTTSMPAPGTISPGSFRNPGFDPEIHRPTAHRHPSFPFEDNVSHRSSYDQAMFMPEGFPMEEGGQMKDLNINDRSPSVSDDCHLIAKAGIKRRASSPHRESARDERSSVSSAPGGSDLYSRRSLQQLPTSRNSPVSKYGAHHGSVSSASSYGPRNGSMASSYGLSVASSATSYTSGRLSPGALSPAIDPDLGTLSYTNCKALNPSPSLSAGVGIQQPQAHDGVPSSIPSPYTVDSVSTRQNSIPGPIPNGIPNAQGMLMCECCPKKPKKFNTQDELRAHLMEKQYTCAYCPNRFKNKNEAERHQNSLHLRRHSWSCAALTTIESVFHSCPTSDGATDMCSFCGLEVPNPPDWSQRHDHVCHDHKFGECNQAKKFFRADHFRQHLKHSHGGLSGKWTNVLETVCMRDEPLPQTMADRASQMLNVGSVSATVMAPSVSVIAPQDSMPNPSMGMTQDGRPDTSNDMAHGS